MGFIKTLFYICGIVFFVIIIIAAFIFIYKTTQTANAIKRMLTSQELEDLILKFKDKILPMF